MEINELNILIINLEKNPLRKKFMTDQMLGLGLTNYKFIEAIDGQILPIEEREKYLSRKNFKTMITVNNNQTNKKKIWGRVGCLFSHLKALEFAVDNDYQNILILEDDMKLDPLRFNDPLPKYILGSDMLYLGGTLSIKNTFQTFVGWNLIDSNKFKCYGTGSYIIIGNEKIKTILEIIKNVKPSAIDNIYVNHIHSLGKSYIINPVRCIHNDNFISDVSCYGKPTKHRYKHLQYNLL